MSIKTERSRSPTASQKPYRIRRPGEIGKINDVTGFMANLALLTSSVSLFHYHPFAETVGGMETAHLIQNYNSFR